MRKLCSYKKYTCPWWAGSRIQELDQCRLLDEWVHRTQIIQAKDCIFMLMSQDYLQFLQTLVVILLMSFHFHCHESGCNDTVDRNQRYRHEDDVISMIFTYSNVLPILWSFYFRALVSILPSKNLFQTH